MNIFSFIFQFWASFNIRWRLDGWEVCTLADPSGKPVWIISDSQYTTRPIRDLEGERGGSLGGVKLWQMRGSTKRFVWMLQQWQLYQNWATFYSLKEEQRTTPKDFSVEKKFILLPPGFGKSLILIGPCWMWQNIYPITFQWKICAVKVKNKAFRQRLSQKYRCQIWISVNRGIQ